MVARGYGALVFGYDDDGNFAQGRWQYRLTSLLVDAPASAAAPAGSGRSFGNILFYERDDRSFLSFVHALLESCIAPCER